MIGRLEDRPTVLISPYTIPDTVESPEGTLGCLIISDTLGLIKCLT